MGDAMLESSLRIDALQAVETEGIDQRKADAVRQSRPRATTIQLLMGRRRAVLPLVAAVSLAVAATACGSSGRSEPRSAPSEPSASTSKSEITAAYQTLFDFASHNVSAMTAVVQDGSSLSSSMSQAISSSLAASATGAKVLLVSLISKSACTSKGVPSPCASVSYDILGSGNSVTLGPEVGYATYSRGNWLVAKTTICNLLDDFYAASGNGGTPKGCPSS